VGHAPDGPGPDLVDLDLAGQAAGGKLGRPALAVHVEDDDVGLYLGLVEPHAGHAREATGEARRVRVILGEPVDHALERDQPGRGEDAHLAHAATQHLSHAARPRHELARAADERADRRRQTLGQAEGEGVDRPREVGDRPAERHRGVEDTRAVEMHGDAVGARRRRDVGDLLRRAAGAAVAVVRILEADEAGDGDVDVAGPHVIADLGGGEEASLGGDRQGLHPAEDGGARAFVVEDVRIPVEDDLLAVTRLGEHANQVALCAGGDEERGLFAREARRQLLETTDGRVFLPNVVAHVGARHGFAHRRCRQRQCVGAEIHEVVHG